MPDAVRACSDTQGCRTLSLDTTVPLYIVTDPWFDSERLRGAAAQLPRRWGLTLRNNLRIVEGSHCEHACFPSVPWMQVKTELFYIEIL